MESKIITYCGCGDDQDGGIGDKCKNCGFMIPITDPSTLQLKSGRPSKGGTIKFYRYNVEMAEE